LQCNNLRWSSPGGVFLIILSGVVGLAAIAVAVRFFACGSSSSGGGGSNAAYVPPSTSAPYRESVRSARPGGSIHVLGVPPPPPPPSGAVSGMAAPPPSRPPVPPPQPPQPRPVGSLVDGMTLNFNPMAHLQK
jgi:hypothetical protein